MTICGIDEVGRGCLAGDVYACAVVFHSTPPDGIRDSKKLSAAARRSLDASIRACAHVSIGIATVQEIDRINILQATMLAMTRAFDALPPALIIGQVLVDGNRAPRLSTSATVRTVVQGDATEICIGAASIVAKVARDRAMEELHRTHPHYDWASNKGYGSPKHLAAIAVHGPTTHHRMTFAPMREPSLAV